MPFPAFCIFSEIPEDAGRVPAPCRGAHERGRGISVRAPELARDNPGISEAQYGNPALAGKKARVARAKVPHSAKFPRKAEGKEATCAINRTCATSPIALARPDDVPHPATRSDDVPRRANALRGDARRRASALRRRPASCQHAQTRCASRQRAQATFRVAPMRSDDAARARSDDVTVKCCEAQNRPDLDLDFDLGFDLDLAFDFDLDVQACVRVTRGTGGLGPEPSGGGSG